MYLVLGLTYKEMDKYLVFNHTMIDLERLKSWDKAVLNTCHNNDYSSSCVYPELVVLGCIAKPSLEYRSGGIGLVWQKIQKPLTQDNHRKKS